LKSHHQRNSTVFRYNTTIHPPAAFVQVTLLDPITGLSVQEPGKLDTNQFILTLDGKALTFDLRDP